MPPAWPGHRKQPYPGPSVQQQSPHGHQINQHSLVDSCWHWREKRTADTHQNRWISSCRRCIPCWSTKGCWVLQCKGLKVCWAGHTCRIVIINCWAVRCWRLTCWVGNFLWIIHNDWLVISCWPIACWPVICWAVICWAVICRVVTCRAIICWPVHNLWRTRHCCWVVHFSCRFFHMFWPGRRRNHCYGSLLWWLGNGRGQRYFPSGDVWWTRPLRLSRLLSWWWPGGDLWSADAFDEDEDRDLRSPEDLRWWWWAWEEEAEGWASVALETRLDPEPPVEFACLLELDPPEDVGRDHSPSRRPLSCLDEWCLGESWRLSDPCDLLLWSPLCDRWHSDPSELGRPTTDTLEATDFLGSRDLEGWTADCSTSVAFDQELLSIYLPILESVKVLTIVAILARLDLDDPSLERLAGSWRTSSGACISTESSIVSRSWDFFAAFTALHLRFCSLAFSCACQACGSQSLQISQGESLYTKWAPRLVGTAGSNSGCHYACDSECSPGTSAATQWKTTTHVAILSTQARLDTETK